MSTKQETLIYIEEGNTTEANFMSKSFVDKEVKNRAYINALGAELALKYLSSEGIKVSNIHNIHSISKVLEKYDIADIQLPNIYIDVRVVFDEKQIFIPKSHFKSSIVPNVYMILKLDEKFEHVEFLGFIEPEKINRKNASAQYYFVEKGSLVTPDKFKRFVKNFTGTTSRKLSEEDILRGRELSISFADHNISAEEEKEFLELLLLSDELRESVLEFDNFETLAYSTASVMVSEVIEPAAEILPLVEDLTVEPVEDTETEVVEETEETQVEELSDELVNELVEAPVEEILEEVADELSEEPTEEIFDEALPELTTEEVDLSESMLEEESDIALEQEPAELESLVSDENADIIETVEASEEIEPVEDIETIAEFEEPIVEDFAVSENILETPSTLEEVETLDISDNLTEDAVEEPVEDEISIEDMLNVEEEGFDSFDESLTLDSEPETLVQDLDNEPQADSEDTNKDINLAETITNALKTSIETGAEIAGAAGIVAAGAAAAQAGELVAGATISDEAIKLAGVAGDLVNSVVDKNVEEQQKNLDRIDYAKTDIMPDVKEIPDHVAELGDLSIAKMEANLAAEESGQFETPLDLDSLNTIEDIHEDLEFEQEIIDLGAMETVENDDIFEENTDEIVNLSSININSPTKVDEPLPELNAEENFEGIDLPSMSSFSINEDGTSNIDHISTEFAYQEQEDHLVDFEMNSLGNVSIDENPSDEDFVAKELPIEHFGMTAFEDENLEISEDLTAQDENSISTDDFFAEHEISTDEISDLEQETEPQLSEELLENAVDAEDLLEIDEPVVMEDLPVQEDVENIESEVEISELDPDFIELDQSEEQEDEQLIEQPVELLAEELELQAEDLSEEQLQEDTYEQSELQTDEELLQVEEQSEEPVETEQDWIEDTNYDNLEDIELPPVVEQESQEVAEEMIIEPDANAPKVFAAVENSRVITDKEFTVGEIPIDINEAKIVQYEGSESLEQLYNEESAIAGEALLQTPGRLGSGIGSGVPAAGLIGKAVAGLVVLAVICGIGFGVAKLFKTPTDEAPQPITDDALPTAPENVATDNNTLDVNQENVVSMDASNALLNTTTLKQTEQQSEQQNATPTTAQAKADNSVSPVAPKPQAGTTISISKLTWEVPDYVSYNPQFKGYFQAVGKSLKLALTSDLLLATDYAYSNEVRVSVSFDKDGNFKSSQIFKSSGSSQIDGIVLQTVNQTLKALKAPNSVGNDENTTAVLKIYF